MGRMDKSGAGLTGRYMGKQACSQGKVLGLWMKILINFPQGSRWGRYGLPKEPTSGPVLVSTATARGGWQEAARTFWPELTFKLGTNGGNVTVIAQGRQALMLLSRRAEQYLSMVGQCEEGHGPSTLACDLVLFRWGQPMVGVCAPRSTAVTPLQQPGGCPPMTRQCA